MDERALDHRSKLVFGVAVICGLFLTETAVAHRTVPHPASPLIWAALGAVALVAVAVGLWCRVRLAQLRRLNK